MLFCESAWHGNEGRWATMMSAAGAPKQPVRDLVAWCREQGIPTVFWNKEDPPNFDRFIETAKLFDHVFTVDADCIPRYVEALGHDRVALLPFGAQPRVHNPISVRGGRRHEVAFAGTYHAKKYPERAAQMDTVLGPAREFDLHIYSRISDDPDFAFPPEYTDHIVGSLPYEQMLAAYKAYKVFLNVNSVTESPTMCARRVFELSACGTPVVSGLLPRAGGTSSVTSCALATAPEQTTEALVEPDEGAPSCATVPGHLAMRKVFESTCSATARLAARRRACRCRARDRSISVILPTNRPDQVDHAIAQVARRPPAAPARDGPARLPRRTASREGARGRPGDVVVLTADSSLTLGSVHEPRHRRGRRRVPGQDGRRQPLRRALPARPRVRLRLHRRRPSSGRARTTARCARRRHAAAHPAPGAHQAELVQGGTILADGDCCASCASPTCRARSTATCCGARSRDSVGIYSADRFNFVSVRGDREAHTWKVDDTELMRHGRVAFHGSPGENVLF